MVDETHFMSIINIEASPSNKSRHCVKLQNTKLF